MEKISAFKTTDGEVFYDRKEAKAHQKSLDIYENLTELPNVIGDKFIDPVRLGDWLCSNRYHIEAILKGKKTSDIEAEIQASKASDAVVAESDDELEALLGEVAQENVA